jgi:lipopolysaccharide/colanic/teichoic acid biosynthesis glycosyltransferase
MAAKRIFDLFFTIPGLVLLAPLFAAVAAAIKATSPGPVFFRQLRVGRFEQPFFIYKFRTMVVDAERIGKQITVGEDARITPVGRFLRKYKIDELPQLLNVIKGEMSLVGARPEVPRYVAAYPPDLRAKIFSLPPGITDQASVEFRDESAILARAADPEKEYLEKILPTKLAYYAQYADTRTLWGDFILILRTIRCIFR